MLFFFHLYKSVLRDLYILRKHTFEGIPDIKAQQLKTEYTLKTE